MCGNISLTPPLSPPLQGRGTNDCRTKENVCKSFCRMQSPVVSNKI